MGAKNGWVNEFLRIGPHAGAHRVATRAAISVLVPLLFLHVAGHMDWTAYAAFGAFTSLYGRTDRYADRTSMQAVVAAVLVLGVTLGTVVALLPWRNVWIVVVGALLAVFASLVSDATRWHPPGPLFVVFGFTVCASMPASPQHVPLAFAISSAAALFAMLIGHAGALREPRSLQAVPLRAADFRAAWNAQGVRRHLTRLAISVGIAGAIAMMVPGGHPAWAMVAVVAGLTGRNRRARVTRGMQRIVGTVAGVGVAALILPLYPEGLVAVLLAALLQFGAEMLVGRNYALAMLCVTPLALLVGQLGHQMPVGPLLFDRLFETLIGCGVAVLALIMVSDTRIKKSDTEALASS